jgi:acyl carrier protein
VTKQELREAVEGFVSSVTGEAATDVRDETRLDDLDMDSLDVVELALEIEDAYAIDIPDAEIARFQTVGDVIDSAWSKMPLDHSR